MPLPSAPAVREASGSEFLPSIPELYRADSHRGVFERREAKDRLDRAVDDLTRLARESDFTELDVLVRLATLQVERGAIEKTPQADHDLANAALNLSRALVMEEHFAPALNQLTLLHLTRAKRTVDASADERRCLGAERMLRAEPKPASMHRQGLELAMSIGLQTEREHPTYAPIHNTVGLIEVELCRPDHAIGEFEYATRLAPSFLEAQNNLAAALLSLRNFEAAERAYDRALDLSTSDYDAHLGRALARRGQISDSNFATQVRSVESDLERCIALDPERPEAYYNGAILAEQFKLRAAPRDQAKSVIQQARSMFDTFIAKAAGRPEYAREVRLAKRRVYDISAGREPWVVPDDQRAKK